MPLFVSLEEISKVFPVGSSATSDLVAAMAGGAIEGQVPGKVAVDGVTLTLREGDRVGIVGRNGAGKSTLLHMIAGISEPTAGTIRINGKVTSIMTLGVGLRDDLSGRENIYVDGEIQGKSRQEVDVVINQVIAFAELGKFIDYPVRTYSTGMKARLAFSMITHIEPEILIIDEALSVGDASFSAKATARILDICARGKIVILVSHGMQSIRDICNRCLFLKDGRVVMDGSPVEVTKAYIDEVQGEDEAALMKRFAAHIGSRSFRAGSAVERVLMFSGDEQTSSVRIEARQNLKIQVVATQQGIEQQTTCRVKIIRLDDLVLFQQDFPMVDFMLEGNRTGIEIEFSPLVLGAAVYRLDVSILADAKTAAVCYAQSSTVFEVYSLAPPVGGKPMLYYPVTVTASPS